MAKVWSKRFDNALDPFIEKFNASIGFDRKLILEDLDCSIAHAKMLGKTKVLSSSEALQIINGLELIKVEYLEGKFSPSPPSEDIHYCIEEKLISLIGETGKKLHTGRSRNDQVGTDIRLWLRKEIDNIEILITELQKSFLNIAKSNIYTLIPGYTHMQRAQPLSLAHHLLAYVEMLQRDRLRFKEVRSRVNISPLGAAALAGTKIKIDRHFTAAELGFKKIYKNSIDAVSDRDFCIEFVSASAILMSHLSKISEEIILWVTDEFSFAKLTDKCATGSSLMPQKKNPDIFDTAETISSCIKAMTILINEGIEFDIENLSDSVENDFSNATDLADYLVDKDVPFRTAYQVVGQMVKYCLERKMLFKNLKIEEFKKFHPEFDEDVFVDLKPLNVVKSRNSEGGTGFVQVEKEVNNWQKRLLL